MGLVKYQQVSNEQRYRKGIKKYYEDKAEINNEGKYFLIYGSPGTWTDFFISLKTTRDRGR